MLSTVGACDGQLSKFSFMYPAGAEVTGDAIRIAADAGLNINFCVRMLSPNSAIEFGCACARACGVEIKDVDEAGRMLWADSSAREKHAARAWLFSTMAMLTAKHRLASDALVVEAAHAACLATGESEWQTDLLADFLLRDMAKRAEIEQ